MTADGEAQGHYTFDLKTKHSLWYRTSDNQTPTKISRANLSKRCGVVLGLYRTIQDYTGLYRSIQDYIGLYMTI